MPPLITITTSPATRRWQCSVSEALPRRPVHHPQTRPCRWMSLTEQSVDKPPSPPVQRSIISMPTNAFLQRGTAAILCSLHQDADRAPRRPHRRASLR